MQCGVPGVAHIGGKDWTPVIERALQLPGFTEADCKEFPDKKVTVGFGHNAGGG